MKQYWIRDSNCSGKITPRYVHAYKTTFAQQLEKFQVTQYQSASHPEDDFFRDIFKEQSHGTR